MPLSFAHPLRCAALRSLRCAFIWLAAGASAPAAEPPSYVTYHLAIDTNVDAHVTVDRIERGPDGRESVTRAVAEADTSDRATYFKLQALQSAATSRAVQWRITAAAPDHEDATTITPYGPSPIKLRLQEREERKMARLNAERDRAAEATRLASVERAREEQRRTDLSKQRRASHLKEHPEITGERREAITEGRLLKGMTRADVIAAVGDTPLKAQEDNSGMLRELWLYNGLLPDNELGGHAELEFNPAGLVKWRVVKPVVP